MLKYPQNTVFLLLLTTVVALTGCGTIHFDVLKGKRVKLLERDAPTSVCIERPIWYALWGGIALSENHTAPFIDSHDLVEVKLHNQQSLWDSIINTFTVILSFSRRTMVIEGNPAGEVSP